MGVSVNLVRFTVPKLLPFFATFVLYFVLSTYDTRSEVWSTVVKCAPIYSLILFILLYGVHNTNTSYTYKILAGLFFSSIGDLLLNINLFEFGVLAFAAAQVAFIAAFGFRPRRWDIGLTMIMGSLAALSVLLNSISSTLLRFCLPVYSFLLVTMAWRAVARASTYKDKTELPKILGAIGGVLFVISDGFLAFNKFYVNIPYAVILIMVPYYLAECGIALSVVDYKYLPVQ
ncbi:lysoplasmalogenase-like protein TMEM86A [Phlebotomus argentipes]|uniref:lysoplasmalogenase-like protein TMEM86A n=1 Tax=Phlebotomus argentipes TaxID=94469 RepID=UPI00289320A5|nr:lysoplasmalogenase-like protein TMEM86A [Phlebotomus argentipes]